MINVFLVANVEKLVCMGREQNRLMIHQIYISSHDTIYQPLRSGRIGHKVIFF